MSSNKKVFQFAGLVLIGALGAHKGAHAQQAGTWLVRAGATSINPQVDSGQLSAPSLPDVRIAVDSNTTLGGGVSYMLTDNWSVDLPLALPFKHHISGDGAIAGSGEIATTKAMPATLFLQYRMREANASWRPYVGAGVTYAHFMKETGNGTLTAITNPGGPGTTLKIKDQWALSVQTGLTVALTPSVFLEGTLGYTWLKAHTTLSTGQTIDAKISPIMAGLYVGYRY